MAGTLTKTRTGCLLIAIRHGDAELNQFVEWGFKSKKVMGVLNLYGHSETYV